MFNVPTVPPSHRFSNDTSYEETLCVLLWCGVLDPDLAEISDQSAHLDSGRRPISYQLIGAPPPLPPLLLLFTAPPPPPPHSPVGMTQLVNRFLYPATPARRDLVVQLCGICCLFGIYLHFLVAEMTLYFLMIKIRVDVGVQWCSRSCTVVQVPVQSVETLEKISVRSIWVS